MAEEKETVKMNENDSGLSLSTFFLLIATGALGLGTLGAITPVTAFAISGIGAIGFSTQLNDERLNLWAKLKSVIGLEKTLSTGLFMAGLGLLSVNIPIFLSGLVLVGLRFQEPKLVAQFEQKIDNIAQFFSLANQMLGVSAPSLGQAIALYKDTRNTVRYVATTTQALINNPAATVAQETSKAIVVAGNALQLAAANPVNTIKTSTSFSVGATVTVLAGPTISIISNSLANAAYVIPVIGPVISPVVWLGTEAIGHWLAFSLPANATRQSLNWTERQVRSLLNLEQPAALKQLATAEDQELPEQNSASADKKEKLSTEIAIHKPVNSSSSRSYTPGFSMMQSGCGNLGFLGNPINLISSLMPFGRQRPHM